MQIFHIATVADWTAAQESGEYTTSTRGRTLAEEGFIHASRGDQWLGVRRRFYADVTEPLVLLTIETELLQSPVVVEPVADSVDTFPHVYGPINVDAVLTALPLDGPELETTEPSDRSFTSFFLAEMFHNLLVAVVVLVAMTTGAVLGTLVEADWAPLAGIVVGLVVGVPLARIVHHRHAA